MSLGRRFLHFYIFDYCQNLEFFSQDVPATHGSAGESLGKRLFRTRLELIAELDRGHGAAAGDRVRERSPAYGGPSTNAEVRDSLAGLLHREVAAMNLDNFVVRPHRRVVEKYAKPDAWRALSAEAISELSETLSGDISGDRRSPDLLSSCSASDFRLKAEATQSIRRNQRSCRPSARRFAARSGQAR